MTPERDVQRLRANQVGALMRAYRETFVTSDGRKGLTQDAVLRRMAVVDKEYAERYSHATVSRWESGHTRPTLRRLLVFGKAMDLARPETAGLILLAGLAPDFQAASDIVRSGSEEAVSGEFSKPARVLDDVDDEDEPITATQPVGPNSRSANAFALLRVLLIGSCIVAVGYALNWLGWDNHWMPAAYTGFVIALVLAQGVWPPGRDTALRDFFSVTLFFLLSTPLLQFAPIGLDHYSFSAIPAFAGTCLPWMLALLVNAGLAAAAGMFFQTLWNFQYTSGRGATRILQRAIWTAGPPVALVYLVIVVISNVSVWIQMAVLMPVVAAIFTGLLAMRDPELKPGELDLRLLFPATLATAIVSTTLGIATILIIYVSPDLPKVLPDHNLIFSWEIDFSELGFSRDEALDRLNLGYLWHATCVLAYMVWVGGGRFLVAIYRVGNQQRVDPPI